MEEQIYYHKLVKLMQMAYSGELAAAYAYQGHWRAVRREDEREAIRQIEQDEWHHRHQIKEILQQLEAQPNPFYEVKYFLIGRLIGFLCHIIGWYLAMYGAGRLERKNVLEYAYAADYANQCGRPEFVECFLEMSETEWEHEKFFRDKVESHFLRHILPVWEQLPPKEDFRLQCRELVSSPSILVGIASPQL